MNRGEHGRPFRLRRLARGFAAGCLVLVQTTCRLDELLRAPPPANVQVVIAGDTVAVADTARLKARVLVNGEEQTGIRLTWSPGDVAVATVDSTGLVQGVGRGRAGISVTLPRSALVTSQIRVTDTVWIVAAALDLAPLDTVLQSIDDTLCLRPTARDVRGNALGGAAPAFRIVGDADSTIRQAGGAGCVIARKSGARATVQMALDTSTSTTGVTVQQRVASLAIPVPGGPLFTLGATASLSATARDRRGNLVPGAPVSWSSSDTTVLTVDANGQATARGEGSAWVRAQADDGRDSVTITVTPPRLVVSLDTAKAAASEGNTRLRTVKAAIANQGTGSLAWSATGDGAWLSLSKTSGSAPDTITLTFDPAGLAANTYQRSVVITSPGSAGSPRTMPAIFAIAAPTAPAAPQSLAQLRTDGATAIVDTTDQTSAILRATVADADSDATVVLEVEIQPLGTAFTDTPTGASGALASGQTADVTVSGLIEDAGYHWQARARDETGRVSAWTSFGANPEAAADLRVAIPENPVAATGLGQFQSDGTPVSTGADLTTTGMQLKATVGDPDPGDRLRLEVELKGVGTAFDGAGTVVSSLLSSGSVAAISVSGIPDDANYHWRARVVDQTGRVGPWVSFPEAPTNFETAADFHVPPLAEAPDAPTDPSQYQSDGTTPVATGGSAFQSTVVLKARLTDSDPGDQVTLEVEVRPVGTPFSDAATATGSTVASGGTATVTIPGLTEDTDYHWQLRAVDQTLRASPWTSFGANVEAAADFHVAIPQDPNAPTVLGQFRSDGSSGIGIGSTTDERTTVFRATVVDPDPGDQVRLEVETKPLGVGFNGSGTVLSPQVSSDTEATVTLASQGDDQSYHWRARTVDQTGRASAWVTFGGNAEGDIDYRIVAPEPPAPTQSGQFRSNGTTIITLGATTDENTVVLHALLSDPDPGDQIRLEVEAKPVATAFDGAGTLTSGLVASNTVASVTVPGLGDDTDYHWRLRAVDQTSRTSAWESFGGNAETAPDFHVAVPQDPGTPGGLGQFKSDGTTPIAAGATTDQSTIVFKGTVSDADPGDQLQLEVEVQPVGTGFANEPTATGAAVASGQGASVSVGPLSDNTDYHWQVRTKDQTGRTSAWVAFGAGGTDVRVDVPGAPDAPATLQQLKSDGATAIANGATTDQSTVVFSASLSDPDAGDQVRLEVEIKLAASGFTGSNTTMGALGANPGTATVTVNGLGDDTDYHWRARTVDQNSNAGAWVEFPAAGTDFRVQVPQAPVVPAALAQFKSNGATPIATGATTDQNTVVLQAVISDPDPTDQVRLDVEVQPVSQAFADSPTHSTALGANGTVQVTVAGLSDDTQYHWQARSRDNGGSTSNWVSFGGNSDLLTADPDVRVAVPQPPADPSVLSQFRSNGSTSIAVGVTTDESTVVLKATLSDPDPGAQVLLDIELRPTGQAFTGAPTVSGTLGAAGVAQLTMSGLLDDTDYHWRARTRDQADSVSAWVSFGGNADGATDFRVAVPQDPNAPTLLGQFKIDGTTLIATGAITDQTTVVFKATLSDPDAGASLRLEIERKQVGMAFDGTGTDISVAGAPGIASITVPSHAENASYHWRARAVDETNRTSAWESFDVNGETAPDFRINAMAEDPASPATLGQFRGDSVTTIGTGSATNETAVVFKATVSDADPGASLKIEVERKPISNAFDGTGTETLTLGVASGATAILRVSGQADNTSYHWRARTLDETARTSAWVSFDVNSDVVTADADYRIDVAPEAPAAPTSPAQFQSDSATSIVVGGGANQTAVVFKAVVNDVDPADALRLQVEAQPVSTAFTNSPSATSTVTVASGATAIVTLSGLSDNTSYHWQVRTIDANNVTSGWAPFGGNSDVVTADADFLIAGVPEAPGAPTVLGQFKSNGTDAINLGARTNETTVVFRATVTDADPGAAISLEVERKPVGTPFDGNGSSTSSAVGSGAQATVTISGLSDNTAYHWRARAVDETALTGSWVSFPEAGNPETDADFIVDVAAQAPADPTGPGQFKSSGTTVIGTGLTTDQNTVVLKGTVSDPDPAEVLRLQVEVRPLGTGFSDAPTATSSVGVASGQLATVTLASQADNTSYHWQARTIDQDNQTSGWVSFGGNAESAIDYRIEVPEPPAAPTTLAQFKSNGSTMITTGAATDENTVVLQAAISDPDPTDQVRLDLEVRPVGTSFTGTPTHSGTLGSGATVQVSVSGLIDDVSYHWRARSRDQSDSVSAWVSFPESGNLESATDFAIAIPQDPNAPSGLKQLKSFGTASIAVGDTTKSDSLVFRALVSDPDPGDQLRIEVEWKQVASAFDGLGTLTSTPVASGDTVVVTVTGLTDDAAYHWRVRALDQDGRMSSWVSFPESGNAESATDFRVWRPQNPSSPSGPDQFNTLGAIPVGTNTGETTVTFKATLSDPDPGDSVRLEVERQPVGTAFANEPTQTGSQVASGQLASVAVTIHTENEKYHWRVRATDEIGRKSAWVPFGGNAENEKDYGLNGTLENPSSPTSLGQFKIDGTTAIAVGGDGEISGLNVIVVMNATVTDADPGDSLLIAVETRQTGTGFSNTATHTGTVRVGSGQAASVTVSTVRPVFTQTYHWQAQVCDQTGRCSGWVSFGGNAEAAADYALPGTLGAPPQGASSP